MAQVAIKPDSAHRETGLPIEEACFPVDGTVDPAALHARLRAILHDFRAGARSDPFGNPVMRTALELTRLVDRGEMSASDIEQTIGYMTANAFAGRAARISRFLGETDPGANEASLRRLIDAIARPDKGRPPIAYEQFRARMEAFHDGIVFTAHPTFSMPRELSRTLASLAAGREPDGTPVSPAGTDALMDELRHARHRPPVEISLDTEFDWAAEAIGNVRDALERLHGVVLDVAREHYPDRWQSLVPQILSVGSWVGYDHDGRSDIGWSDTLRMHLQSKRAGLARLADRCAAIRQDFPRSRAVATIRQIESILAAASDQVERQTSALLALDDAATETAQVFARKLVDGREHALTATRQLRQLLAHAAEEAEDPTQARRIVLVLAALAGHGAVLAHPHFRINAAQIHNAIRHRIGLEGSPNDPSHRRTFTNAINALLPEAEAKPATINIGSLMTERASARRMFMVIAQLTKYIDRETPIRFLIAETETAFTLLVAHYYARLFGIEHLIEITPLFETEEAMDRGAAIIEDALQSPHYRGYVRRLGRICIQFGYSDSGRYVGQMAATFLIERLRLRIARTLSRIGMRGIQVVLFDTHGESIGRGGHPVSLADRFRYVSTPVSRVAFRRAGFPLKEEISFQGGDGYVPFLAPDLAFAAVCRMVEATFEPETAETGDPVYTDPDFAAEFFAVVRQEFASIVADPDYAVLLGTFATNLVDRTGSRPTRRQHEGRAGAPEFLTPSQIRAITNNAVLHQLGLLANTVSGLGRASARATDRFRVMIDASPRFRRAMAMVETALSLSEMDVLRAYVDTADPGMWLNRSGRTPNLVRRDELRVIFRQLEQHNVYPQLARIYRRLQADFLLLRQSLAECGHGEDSGHTATIEIDQEDLALLHAMRISIIHRIFLLSSHIPDFAPYQELTRDDLFRRILRLDVEEAVALLKGIFPKTERSNLLDLDFAEPASYRSEAGQTYEHEHEAIFEPIAGYFELLRRISAAVTHHIGAVG